VVSNSTTLPGVANPVSAACTGTIAFSNSAGTIGTPTTFSVTPGQFKTVTLPFSGAGLTGIRGEIRGEVSVALPTASSSGCSLVLSFETYDSTTGATHALLNGSLAGLAGSIMPAVATQVP
jgi:hypothetical protein